MSGLPTPIVMAYRAANCEGYIFVAQVFGFGGLLRIMSSLGASGNFVASTVIFHNETPSFLNKVLSYRDAEEACGRSLLHIHEISGATITLRAYQNAIRYALVAHEAVRGRP